MKVIYQLALSRESSLSYPGERTVTTRILKNGSMRQKGRRGESDGNETTKEWLEKCNSSGFQGGVREP